MTFIWFQYNTATITSIFNHWIDRNWIRIKILTLYSYLNKNFLIAFSTCTRKNSNFWLNTTADYGSCIQSIVLLLYDTRAISKSNDDSVLIFCCPSLFRVHRVAKNNTRTLRTLLTSSSSTAAASQNKPWNSLQPCMTDSLLGHFPACVSHSSSTDENFPSSRKTNASHVSLSFHILSSHFWQETSMVRSIEQRKSITDGVGSWKKSADWRLVTRPHLLPIP